jgi:hypothetical protein
MIESCINSCDRENLEDKQRILQIFLHTHRKKNQIQALIIKEPKYLSVVLCHKVGCRIVFPIYLLVKVK